MKSDTDHIVSKYGRIFDLLEEMIVVLDRDGRVVDYNTSAERSIISASVLKKGFFVDQVVEGEAQSEFTDLMRLNPDHRAFQSRLLRRDGRTIDVAVEAKELPSRDDTYRILIIKDITELKKKELDLLRFSNVIHNTINPIQITDPSGNMVYVNPAFERVSGYSNEELIGKNPRVLSSGRHRRDFWEKVWQSILGRKVWHGQLENRRKDGTPFYTDLVISPIIEANGAVVGFLGAHRDITEQRLLEQQLVRSQKLEAIGTLAAGIAHEVGNPLTSIASLVQLLQRTSIDKFANEKLEMINAQINRITKIIRNLVNFSRPTTHQSAPSDINQIIRDALNIVQYGKKVKDIRFDVQLKTDLPAIHIVADQVVQVFINILMNAVDALDEKPGIIGITEHITGNQMLVEITDSGKGMDPGALEKIFEPFFTTKEVGRGTGLGLWVSYGIMKSLGGDIVVRSREGAGSTFIVQFPLEGI
jgi:PAS domain S-box-containing protein